jgi:CelD/BcsL family acetyltransferase involved in cellulose biosynthesis
MTTLLQETHVDLPGAIAPGASVLGELQLEIITDEERFLKLAPDWDRLLERSATRSPFLRWDWISLWWAEEKKSFELAVAVLRDESGAVQAIAPLVLGRPMAGARRGLRHLAFMGGIGQIGSFRLDFIVPRGLENQLTPLLCRVFGELQHRWDMVRLVAVAEESPNLPHILQALRGCGVATEAVNTHECDLIELPPSWHDYEMSRSGNWRSQMRRKWKAMEQEHHGRVALAGVDMAVPDAMSDLATLHARRWPENVSEYLRPAAQRFHHRLAERWIPQGRALLPFIQIGGRMAGAIYCLVEADTVYHYQTGWDPAYEHISMGKLAMAASVQLAIGKGARLYDLLPGEFEYKKRWCSSVRHVFDLESFHPRSTRASVFRALRSAKRLLTRTRKSTPQPALHSHE